MSDVNEGGGRRLAVFAINEAKELGKKARWTRIGAAYPNRDGSVTLILDALPIGTNRLQVREQRDDLRWGAAGGAGNGRAAPAEADGDAGAA